MRGATVTGRQPPRSTLHEERTRINRSPSRSDSASVRNRSEPAPSAVAGPSSTTRAGVARGTDPERERARWDRGRGAGPQVLDTPAVAHRWLLLVIPPPPALTASPPA